MHFRTLVILLFFFSSAQSQNSRWTTSFSLNRDYKIGDSRAYIVKDFFKIDNLFFGSKSEVTSLVEFTVVDTVKGGAWIRYTVYATAAKQKGDSSAYLEAELMDGICLYLYVKGDYTYLDSASYFKTKRRVAEKLYDLTVGRSLDKASANFLNMNRPGLHNADGLDFLLGPLKMFEKYYQSKVYKKFRLTAPVVATNNLSFGGSIAAEWKSTAKDSTVELNYTFTGDPYQAAAFYKPIYDSLLEAAHVRRGKHFYPPEMIFVNDYTFETNPRDPFPSYMFRKHVSEYLLRMVGKLEMKPAEKKDLDELMKRRVKQVFTLPERFS